MSLIKAVDIDLAKLVFSFHAIDEHDKKIYDVCLFKLFAKMWNRANFLYLVHFYE